MPCNSGPSEAQEREAIEKQLREERDNRVAEAALCGLMRAMIKMGVLVDVLPEFDEHRSGVSIDEMLVWFENHCQKDAKRDRLEQRRIKEKTKIFLDKVSKFC